MQSWWKVKQKVQNDRISRGNSILPIYANQDFLFYFSQCLGRLTKEQRNKESIELDIGIEFNKCEFTFRVSVVFYLKRQTELMSITQIFLHQYFGVVSDLQRVQESSSLLWSVNSYLICVLREWGGRRRSCCWSPPGLEGPVASVGVVKP